MSLGLSSWPGLARTWLYQAVKREVVSMVLRSLGSQDWDEQIHCSVSYLLMPVGDQVVAKIRRRLPFSLRQHLN